MQSIFTQAGIGARLHFAGVLQGQALADALHAMDVFAFASHSETQGIVLTEAMAAGLPVIALDASGVREVVEDGQNGRLLEEESVTAFSAALQWLAERSPEGLHALRQGALGTAEAFSMSHSADKALALYEEAMSMAPTGVGEDEGEWDDVFAWVLAEWDILKTVAGAGDAAIGFGLSSDKEH
jgi:glycosyltransferase involved in cell wall biosynthesis